MIKLLLLFYVVKIHILLVGKRSYYFFLKLMLKLKLIKTVIAHQKFTRRLMRKEKKCQRFEVSPSAYTRAFNSHRKDQNLMLRWLGSNHNCMEYA